MLIAIDGTDSAEDARDFRGSDGSLCLNLSVANFFQDYGTSQGAQSAPAKLYSPGPNIVGSGLQKAIEESYAFLLKRVTFRYRLTSGDAASAMRPSTPGGFGKTGSGDPVDTIGKICARIVDARFQKQNPIVEAIEQTGEAIDLVGFSRGAFGVMLLAKKLEKIPLMGPQIVAAKIRFVGLYDGVARYLFGQSNSLPANIEHIYHAIRDDTVNSRWYFGHVDNPAFCSAQYTPWIFRGTHGAIGGDPVGGDRVRRLSPETAARMALTGPPGLAIALWGLQREDRISLADNQAATVAADEWMRRMAAQCGVPITTDQRCHTVLNWAGASVSPSGQASQRLYSHPE